MADAFAPKRGALQRAWLEAETIHRILAGLRRRKRLILRRLKGRSDWTFEQIVKNAPSIVEYAGNRFDLAHPRCSPQIGAGIVEGTYERHEIDLMRRYIDPRDKVLELGSCMGVTSLFLADLVGEENHLVIEADPLNLELSEHMFDLNGTKVRSRFGFLVSGDDEREFVQFSSNENPSSSSSYAREGTARTFDVPTIRFEELLKESGATAIVLDIEGGEVELFYKAQDLGQLRLVIMETHPWVTGEDAMAAMLASLKKRGFATKCSTHGGRYLVLRREDNDLRSAQRARIDVE